jgi:hypothetical protein
MDEVTLPGGRTVGAVLAGEVVYKAASPAAPAVHALLRHLAEAGFDGAPRALGFDAQGRQMLTYLRGETIGERNPWPAWVFADTTLVQVGRWLRRVHELAAAFVPPDDASWFISARMGPGMVFGHQDAAPYNAVVDGDRLVGFCDWDIAGPTWPELDLGYSALMWVPLHPPGTGQPLDPDNGADRYRRLHLLLDAYGYTADRREFATAIPQRAWRQAGVIRRMADAGDPASIALLFFAEQLERSAAHVEALPEEFWFGSEPGRTT